MKADSSNAEKALYAKDKDTYHEAWHSKPLLKKIYGDLYTLASTYLTDAVEGDVIEIGSGAGQIHTYMPQVIRTDIFESESIDRVEDVYRLTFDSESTSNIIMLDVFHHLRFPGDALHECRRVLSDRGRLIIIEPYVGPFSLPIYGLCHHEPLGLLRNITWHDTSESRQSNMPFAAQAQSTRIFFGSNLKTIERDWHIVERQRLSMWRYVASGGFRKMQLYPTDWYERMAFIDRMAGILPTIFGTRFLVVLEKRS